MRACAWSESPVQREKAVIARRLHAVIRMQAAAQAVAQREPVIGRPLLLIARAGDLPGSEALLPVVAERDRHPMAKGARVAPPLQPFVGEFQRWRQIARRVEVG